MRIKKFYADNYNEALQCVKRELGQDAMILSTRSIKYDGDDGGTRCATLVEITAAMEPDRDRAGALKPTFERSPEPPGFLKGQDDFGEFRALAYSLLTRTERAQSMNLKPDQLPVFQNLVDRGVDESLACRIFRKINSEDDSNPNPHKPLNERIQNLMKSAVRCAGGIELKPGRVPKVAAFVGPTGVGKTTTLAKLAAHYALEEQKRIALVSLDTYRMGALEQLQIYGDLMNVPVEQAGDRRDLLQTFMKHADKDLILIDTMGRNPGDRDYVDQLKSTFKAIPDLEIHLTLSVTTREDILSHALEQFAPLGVDRLLFTKLDEARHLGSLFNTAVRAKNPFSYLTTGQRVPEDIEVAVQDRVIRLIFK